MPAVNARKHGVFYQEVRRIWSERGIFGPLSLHLTLQFTG